MSVQPPANPPLTAPDAAQLRAAQHAVGAGNLAGAVAALQQLSPAAGSHPAVLSVAARVLLGQGRHADARRTAEAVTAMVPGDAAGWFMLADACEELGDLAAAEAALLAALRIVPGQGAGWINLGLLRISRADWAGARAAATSAAALVPGDHRPAQITGLAARAEGAVDAAVTAFAAAHRLAPADPAGRHNLAEALRAADRGDEALALLGDSTELPPPTRLLRAQLCDALARFEPAIDDYRAAGCAAPELTEAHELLARLLPTLGRGDEALAHYAPALAARPTDRALWQSAVGTAKDLGEFATVAAWSEAALLQFPADPAFLLARGIADHRLGRRAEAIDTLRYLATAHPGEAGIRNHLAPMLLAAGEWRAAEAEATMATRLDPLDQSGWAWLSVAWRLLGDAREDWLADYDRLVLRMELPFDPGDLARLAEVLTALHVTGSHPPNQSPRGGTQTRGNLFDKRLPEVAALAGSIRTAIEGALARLTPDPTHPFLSRLAPGIAFAGSWSIRLRSAGFHQNHIHHSGWLSSACYIALPPEVLAPEVIARTGAGGQPTPGSLLFGVPDAALGLDLAPRRIVRPALGRLALFPSYFWHGTTPFESDAPRLTVAFDALPSGGRR